MRCKEITFILGNTEEITVPGACIETMNIWDVHRCCTVYLGGDFEEYERCDFFTVVLSAEANDIYRTPRGEDTTVFDRLRSGDITAVEFVISTGKERIRRRVCVPWNEQFNIVNPSQKDAIGRAGRLYIVCSEYDRLADVYPDEFIGR